jgi:DNA-binding SARP family transcriptional activator
MKIAVCFVILLAFFNYAGHSQSYGLQFASHEVVQEKRTGLNLSPAEPWCLRADAELSFDLLFAPRMETYFGYVFRIVTADHQNIDLIYNQRLSTFNFIIGETVAGTFRVDSPRLYTQWNQVALHFATKERQLQFYINHRLIGKSKAPFKGDPCFRIAFGTSGIEEFQTADIPPMSIRNIRLMENHRLRYYWPLTEASGDECRDSIEKKLARVTNPIWVRSRHQNWELVSAFQVNGFPSAAFDPGKELLYLITADSLYSFSPARSLLSGVKITDPEQPLPAGHQAIFDPADGRLYDGYIDQKAIRTWIPGQNRWDKQYLAGPLTEFWHADKFLSPIDSSIYLIGGYGQLRYKNLVQRYNLPQKKWEVVQTKGDYLPPRYLGALGTNARGDTAFLMGGYGSNTGDQMVNPKYYYDLVAYSVKDRRFKARYHLKEPEKQFCFANSLIIDDTAQAYYALVFPNDRFNSTLQLIRGSLTTPDYQPLGDTIPYSFYDVRSFADLYYSATGKKLIAVTFYTNKENKTDVRIYTIAFPPDPVTVAVAVVPDSKPYWLYVLVLVVLGGAVWGLLRRWKKTASVTTATAMAEAPEKRASLTSAPAALASTAAASVTSLQAAPPQLTPSVPTANIFFFGQFEVMDKNGNDLTKLFTPLLKELFLLIALYSLRSGKGISSEKLYSTLWRDKSSKDAQNNRSVNMVKLKAILDRLGTCAIVKEADKWVFQYHADEIDIDLAKFFHLLQAPHLLDKAHVRQVLQIIHRGAFLTDTSYDWLDDIQSEISGKVLDSLSEALTPFATDSELLLEIAGSIFLFDPINEEALRVKCRSLSSLGRHSMAKAAFEKFTREYHQMYGEEFQQSFQEVIG